MTRKTENAPSMWLMGWGLFVIQIVQWIAELIAAQFSNLPVVFGLLPSEQILLVSIALQVVYTFCVVTLIAIKTYKEHKQEQQVKCN